jgi:hypothetical protein
MTEFGKLDPDGTYTHIRSIPQTAMMKCPHFIMVADHYREDNSCKCDDPAERAKMIAEWEYTEADFANIPLRDAK